MKHGNFNTFFKSLYIICQAWFKPLFCSIQIGNDNFSQENIPAFPPHRHKKYNIKPSFRAKSYFNLLNLYSYYFYGAFPQ
jgi:hypothetical protein